MHSGMGDSVAAERSGRLYKMGLGESGAGGYKEPQGGGGIGEEWTEQSLGEVFAAARLL